MNQKEAIYTVLKDFAPDDFVDGSCPLRPLIDVYEAERVVAHALKDGYIKSSKYGPGHENSDRELLDYAKKIVHNSLNKDKRLNGGKTYKPKTPRYYQRGYRSFDGDGQIECNSPFNFSTEIQSQFRERCEKDPEILAIKEVEKAFIEQYPDNMAAFNTINQGIKRRKLVIFLDLLGLKEEVLKEPFWQNFISDHFLKVS